MLNYKFICVHILLFCAESLNGGPQAWALSV